MYKVTSLLLPVLCALVTASSSVCAQTTTYDGNFTTPSSVSANLGSSCTFELRASNVLLGGTADEPVPPDELFNVVVEDSNPDNGPIIDGCGDFAFTVEPKDPDVITRFRFGRGTVVARRTSPPELTVAGEPATDLLTPQLADILVGNLPSNVARTFEVDGRTGFPKGETMDNLLLERLLLGGTLPRFGDNCGDVLIRVSDRVTEAGPCEPIRIERTFMARSANAACNMDVPLTDPDAGVVSVRYEIVLARPNLADLRPPAEFRQIACSDPVLDGLPPGQAPAPLAVDFPFLAGPDGPIYLNEPYGNIGASFRDSDPIRVCNGTFKVVRNFSVIDWCRTDVVTDYQQIIKVGDFAPPVIELPTQDLDFNGEPDAAPLVFSTNAPGCGAFLNTNFGGLSVIDDCSGVTLVEAFILVDGDEDNQLGPISVFSSTTAQRLTPFVPAGRHVLRYRAVDDCDNVGSAEVEILIEDRSAPVIIAEDAINVALGGGGFAEVRAEDIDNGSYDDCTDVLLEIAFASENRLLAVPAFGPSITLTCADVGEVPVILRATDANGNANTQTVIINLIDNAAPVCVAPESFVLSCASAAEQLPEDVNAHFAGDPKGTIRLFNGMFGEPTAVDNCGSEVTQQTILSTINDCGTGQIERTFTMTDARGIVSGPGCQQIISVRGIRDYTVLFPGDTESECSEGLDYDGVRVFENACDMVLVNTQVDTFFTESTACYKLQITYDIINWCEYDGGGAVYEIPRDADDDGEATDRTYLHIIPGTSLADSDDVALLDRDGNRDNRNTIGPLDPDDATTDDDDLDRDGDTGYANSRARGSFRYRQYIKVYDREAPTIGDVERGEVTTTGCNDGALDIFFSVTDGCSSNDSGVTVTLDLDYVPSAGFSPGRSLTDGLQRDGNDYTAALTDLPAGEHAIRIRTADGCGNGDQRIVPFTVTSEPDLAPVCIGRLTFVLLDDGNDGGAISVSAADFVRDVNGNCNAGNVNYSIYREEAEAGVPGFTPSITRPRFFADCEDIGDLTVRVYALTDAGRGDYCTVVAQIVPLTPDLCDDGTLGSLAGFITTPERELLPDVEVHITDHAEMNKMMHTDNNGSFLFTGLREGNEYMVRPGTMPDAVNLSHVKTSDIVAISSHILNVRPITDPYVLLAADATGDGYVDIADLVALRRIIIGLDPTFRQGPTWRFLRRDYDLSELREGWDVRKLPATFSVGELAGHNRDADFVAIEVGDVKKTAKTGRSSLASTLTTTDLLLAAGQTAELVLTAGEMIGLQATLETRPGLTLLDWSSTVLGRGHVNGERLGENLLALSYDAPRSLDASALLTLHVRAERALRVSDYLYVSDRLTVSEAYASPDVTTTLKLQFADDPAPTAVRLYQNFPNPVTGRTTITFDLPRPGPVDLRVHDQHGRLLFQQRHSARSGHNNIQLSLADLNTTATGILSYTLVVDGNRYTKRMLVTPR